MNHNLGNLKQSLDLIISEPSLSSSLNNIHNKLYESY